MPETPGMCTSRKQTSGASASNRSIASRPLRASATISSSGHASASMRRIAVRSSGSSSAMSAIGVDVELQAIGHAHAHELEVGAHELELLAERGGGLVQARHRGAKVCDEAVEDVARLGRLRDDELAHVGERVEEEMRLDLRLQ